jgi:hypothetical protein
MAKQTEDETEKMRRLLDAQAQELELRFNQFLKELEADFNYAPSSNNPYEDITKSAPRLRATRLDERLSNIEQHYAEVDKKYTLILWLTGLLTVLVFVYLGYVLLR